MSFLKIKTTGDFLRYENPAQCSQNANMLWFHHLIAPVFATLGVNDINLTGTGQTGKMLAMRFYASVGLFPSLEAWAKLYSAHCGPRQLALLENAFAQSLVISFELPEILAQGLDALNIPFIDFTIHPARFMRELAFGVRTNITGLSAILEPWALSKQEILIEKDIALATLAHRGAPIPDGTDLAIFACQTENDRTLIQNCAFVRLEDVAEELDKICGLHKKVLVKRHPYSGQTEIEKYLLENFPNTEYVEANFYQLLASKNIKYVYSISSGTSLEARYFNKTGTHLIPYPLNFTHDEASINLYKVVRPCFLYPDFWKEVFKILNIDYEDNKISMPQIDLRKTNNQWWAADILYK